MDWEKELDAPVRETAELVARTASASVQPQANVQRAVTALTIIERRIIFVHDRIAGLQPLA
ncbi:hypothetical protein [Bradyrhizobium sp. USDA 4486]